MTPDPPTPRLVRALRQEPLDRPPVWFMRQAGRSLPEYRRLRESAADFIAFCLDPAMAAEASLQPLRRFAFDAAIIFADILLVPWALGQAVWFEAGEGPRLAPLPDIESLPSAVSQLANRLAPVGETVRLCRAALAGEPDRAVIGFCGGPWTVATYMLAGRGGEREQALRMAAARDPLIAALIDVLVKASVEFLALQARAGAQALQLFESWADDIPEDLFAELVTGPHRRIVEGLRSAGIEAPIIGFPRGAGALVEEYAAGAGVQGVGLDVQASVALGRRLQRSHAIQGALDPRVLLAGGAALDRRVDDLLRAWSEGPYIFNLGHGVLPETPLAHIAAVVDRVTGWR